MEMMKKNNIIDTSCLTLKGDNLTTVQKEIFLLFYKSISGSSIIYRGVDGEYLSRRYNTDASNLSLLSELLFLYGDKGEEFCKDIHFEIDINNTERICFQSILNNLKETFSNRNSNNDAVNNRLPEFCKDNYTAIHNIISINEEEWCERIDPLPEETKIKIKDYYISFLHTIGKAGYGNYSYFLSTTKNYKTAEFFRHNDNEDGIIIVGWTNGKGIICTEEPSLKTIVESCGLPTFDKDFFPGQKEITYKCGLLPHFIIGYHYKDKFEINPYILKIEDMSAVRKEGLPVNQKPFIELLSKTNFKSYYNVCDCFYWQQ